MSTIAAIAAYVANSMMVTGSLRSLLTGGFLYLYDGPVPASADDAIDASGHKCFKFTVGNDGSTALTLQNTAVNGVLRKTTAEAWQSTALRTCDVTFWRWCMSTDDGVAASSGSQARVQGTVGTDGTFGMILSSAHFTSGDNLQLTDFQIIMPQAA